MKYFKDLNSKCTPLQLSPVTCNITYILEAAKIGQVTVNLKKSDSRFSVYTVGAFRYDIIIFCASYLNDLKERSLQYYFKEIICIREGYIGKEFQVLYKARTCD